MAEYIEKSVIFPAINKAMSENGTLGMSEIEDIIDDLPAADVQSVIRAKWVLFDRDSVGRAFYCSNCHKVTTTDDFENTPLDRDEYFCMRCGADMRS